MGNVLVNEASLQAIADAIRVKNGSTEKYLPSEMPSAIEGIQSGGGVDNMKLMTQWGNTFYKASFPEETHLVLEYGENFVGDMTNMFSYTSSSKIKSIKIVGNRQVTGVKLNSTFNSCSAEIIDFSECDLVLITGAMQNTFTGSSKLKEIKGTLDVSRVTSFVTTFHNCTALEEVRFLKENIFKSISFSTCKNLSDASIQSIIDGLATVEETQTLTLHVDVKAKLTEAQISQITSKNWTLA